MDLGQRIRQARLEAGLSQRQLCGDTITRNMLSQIENGSARPSMATLQTLAIRLDKPISYFLEENAVLSPNQALMDTARRAYASSDPEGALKSLCQYCSPDPTFDPEYQLLSSLCRMDLARKAIDAGRFPYAAHLLEEAACPECIYYDAHLERERLLLLTKTGQYAPKDLADKLPSWDAELLLRAAAALAQGDPRRCLRLLEDADAACDPQCHLLQADAAFALGEYQSALSHYLSLEETPHILRQLENCYRELGDFKQAYTYALKQR